MCKIPLIAVVGPTASGKTSLSIALAKLLGGEIISADSMQIYKGISIASAAPDESERQGISHHMIEIADPWESWSVADYVNLAKNQINEVHKRGKQPILVGGTGLYVNSLTFGTEFSSAAPDEKVRERLKKEAEELGGAAMLEKLREIDAEAADRLHPNDIKRILRALEIFYSCGITITEQNRNSHNNPSPYDVIFIGITYRDRDKLYSRIDSRVDAMLSNGLLEEARSTLDMDESWGAAAAIGHKELHRHLRGEVSLNEAVEDLKRSTRRYAKRQLTWFRRNDQINWIYADETEDVVSAALEILNGRMKKC